ncbi:MAG: protein kinase [Candidatus Contendobacter sp.]|nr:MAG: protein kinase [Candidatus Contendobacter sp.]
MQTLCMGCMTDKGTATACPRCGFVEPDQPASPAHLPLRTLLQARYVVGRVLGEGGFGITYLGWDETLALRVAIKEFLPHYLATRSTDGVSVQVYQPEKMGEFAYGLEKFLDEARLLARFADHPGIVAVRDFFAANRTGYLVMNYLDGMTFQNYLASQGGRIAMDQILNILAPVMDTLQEIHDAGLLHRDISPDNLFLPTGKPAKLIDFGAARTTLGERSGSLSVIVKQGYAPEEQYRSRGQQGPWTDLYALAATFYCALTGEHPPPAPDRFHQDTLLPPSALGVLLPRAAEAVLLKALAVRSEQRFQTVAEFQVALTWAMEGTGVVDGALAIPLATPAAPVVIEEPVSERSEISQDRYWLAEKPGQDDWSAAFPAADRNTRPQSFIEQRVSPRMPARQNSFAKRVNWRFFVAGLAASLFVVGLIGLSWWHRDESNTASLQQVQPVELSPRDVAVSTQAKEDIQLSPGSESLPAAPFMAASSPRIGPSFDCRKVKTGADKMVCDSSNLSILDLQLANAYREVIARTPTKQRAALVASQNTWLQKTRGGCPSETCLIAEYTKRIRDLESRYR